MRTKNDSNPKRTNGNLKNKTKKGKQKKEGEREREKETESGWLAILEQDVRQKSGRAGAEADTSRGRAGAEARQKLGRAGAEARHEVGHIGARHLKQREGHVAMPQGASRRQSRGGAQGREKPGPRSRKTVGWSWQGGSE